VPARARRPAFHDLIAVVEPGFARPNINHYGRFGTGFRVVMKQVNIAEAKAKLSHLVDQAAKGRGVIIAKSGIPMAKLVPLDEEKVKEFKFGTLKGVITDEIAAAIEAPLPAEILDAMLNGPLDPSVDK
jgi:prevent-host-death family protein